MTDFRAKRENTKKTTSIMYFVDSRTFFNLFYAKYGSKKPTSSQEMKKFFKGYSKRKWLKVAHLQRAEKDIDHILMCIYEV